MKFKQVLIEKNLKARTMYHMTYKRNLRNIKREGITRGNEMATTGAFGQDIRVDKNAVYAFTDIKDALSYGFEMNWERDPKNEIVIIQFRRGDEQWIEDPHWQSQVSKKGWWYTHNDISPKQFTKIYSEDDVFKIIKNLQKSRV